MGEVARVEPEAFFEEALPRGLEVHGEVVGRAVDAVAVPPLGFSVEGREWTLTPAGRSLRIAEGLAGAGLVAELDVDAFSDLVEEEKTPMGLLVPGRVHVGRGQVQDLMAWDLLLRAALDGWPVYEPGAVELVDREGGPLALDQSFAPDGDRAAMRHFVERAGFLHVQSLFTEDEMRAVAADMDRVAADAARDDGASWWITTKSGEERPTRLLDFQARSALTRELLEDGRFAALGEITGSGHAPGDTFGEHFGTVSAEALIKPVDVREGLADLPWHKDCARGGHSRHCCGLTAGIAITRADERHGQLHVIAGSHRAHVLRSGLDPRLDLPELPLPLEPGDVTLHASCTLHTSRPPQVGERRVLYAGLTLPPRPGDARAPVDVDAAHDQRAAIDRQTRPTTRDLIEQDERHSE